MPDWRGATLLEDLPGEIIDMILTRLPPKDVGRCRAVSTSWRSATSTSEFLLEHHRRQPLLPIVDGQGRPASFVILRDAGARPSSQQLWPFLPGAKNSSNNILCASCDGFLIRRDGSGFYICNPVTCKQALLPWPQAGQGNRNTVIGFYRHHPTGQYRVLWVSTSQHFSKCSLYVVTAGSYEPRHITVTMPTVLSPSSERDLLHELRASGYSRRPVHHNGNLHWCPYFPRDIMGGGTAEGGGDIIVFDTEAESFRLMRCPAETGLNRKLFNMKGTLAFWGSSTLCSTHTHVWVMQDYEAEIWALKYRIDHDKVEESRQLYLSSSNKKKKARIDSPMYGICDMVVLSEREVLIMFNDKLVLRCDIDGKFLGMVNIGKSQYCMMLTNHLLQESIIPIPSHEMQGEDGKPAFSAGRA
jgi:F-box interacting protein